MGDGGGGEGGGGVAGGEEGPSHPHRRHDAGQGQGGTTVKEQ